MTTTVNVLKKAHLIKIENQPERNHFFHPSEVKHLPILEPLTTPKLIFLISSKHNQKSFKIHQKMKFYKYFSHTLIADSQLGKISPLNCKKTPALQKLQSSSQWSPWKRNWRCYIQENTYISVPVMFCKTTKTSVTLQFFQNTYWNYNYMKFFITRFSFFKGCRKFAKNHYKSVEQGKFSNTFKIKTSTLHTILRKRFTLFFLQSDRWKKSSSSYRELFLNCK